MTTDCSLQPEIMHLCCRWLVLQNKKKEKKIASISSILVCQSTKQLPFQNCGVVYVVQIPVFSVNVLGFSELEVDTSQLNFTVTTSRNTSLEISWNDASIPEEDFDTLIFKYNESLSNVSRNVSKIHQSMYNLTGLSPGTLYTITCYVSRDGIPSISSSFLENYTSKIITGQKWNISSTFNRTVNVSSNLWCQTTELNKLLT